MAIFDDFELPKKMSDPEVRKAEDLKRSNKKLRGWRKSSNTSVSLNKLNMVLAIVGIIAGLLVAAVVAYGIYFGIQLYLNG